LGADRPHRATETKETTIMSDYFDTGFCVRTPSWHKKEQLVQAHPDSFEQGREWAGLTWEPEERMPYRCVPLVEGVTYPDGTHVADAQAFIPVVEHKLIVRNDTEAVLGVPSKQYEIITHAYMGELLETIVGEGGEAVKLDTMGSCRGGKQTWAVCLLDEPFTVPGDESVTYPYFVAMWDHTGGGSSRVAPTNVRIVCANTWSMADAAAERSGHSVVIRHTGDIKAKVEEAKAVLSGARAEAKAWYELATDLAAVNVSDGLVAMFLDDFIPMPEGDNVTPITVTRREQMRATFTDIYFKSPTTDGVRGTAYGLAQAAGEYLDHARPYRTQDTYLARTLLRPEPIKGRAIRSIRALIDA